MKLSSRFTSVVSGAVLLPIATLASGCAHVPEQVAVPTGEPLSVREHTETGQYTVKEKVGDVEYKDSSGRKIGSSEVYQNKTQTYQYQVWHSYQGNQPISDDDLYRIAKDEQAEREVREHRENGVFLNRLGLGGVLLGAAAVGVGYGLQTQVEPGESANLPRMTMLGGGILATVGAVMMFVGQSKTRTEHPLDQSRASRAANTYNTKLGISGTATTSSAWFGH